MDDLNTLTSGIINAAISVHRELGPGLLESVYQSCLIVEFSKRGWNFGVEVDIPVIYQGIKVNDAGFRLDMLVENQVVIELKSVEKIQPIHKKQLLTYLRLAKKPLGLLINFNEVTLVNGITRIANGFEKT